MRDKGRSRFPGVPGRARAAAIAGARDLSPIILGTVPFGVVAGIAAVEAGLDPWGASVVSTLVFAGASQLAAMNLLGEGANAAVIIGTVAMINLRFVMYSASLATRFDRVGMGRRGIMAYLLTDQSYVVTITKLNAEPDFEPRWAYFVGGALTFWSVWQAATITGALAGSVVPDSIPLAFAIPLVFAALLVPAVIDRATLSAAVSSAVVAVLAAGLPANLGLLAAATTGIAVGSVVSSRSADTPHEATP